MEALDEFLRSQNINLDDLRDEEDRLEQKSVASLSSSIATPVRILQKAEDEALSRERRNVFTDSLLRDDVMAPNIVHFPLTYNSQRSKRRILRASVLLLLVLGLSIYGFSHFNKMVWALSQEAVLDIEIKNITSASQHHQVRSSSSSSSDSDSDSNDNR
jgi:hypothetical protein